MRFSYHAHSVWSDGQAEIAEMIRAAGEAGLNELGMSDHYVLTLDHRQHSWSMPIDRLDEYVAQVQCAAGDAPEGLLVRLGVEADFVPETADELRGILASEPFDYVIGSVHIVDGFLIDSKAEDWDGISEGDRNEIIRTYWVRIRQLAESGLFDFVGHMDLPKKFAIYPTVDISEEVDSALDAIQRAGMAAEVNTAGWFAPCREAYPSPSIVRACFERGIPMLVTADAHTPENVDRAYERAYRLLRDTGYTELASYAGRQRIMQPLPGE